MLNTVMVTLAHATLDTEQIVSCTRTVLVDTIASLLDSDCGVIVASEVHELVTKIHHTLGNDVTKGVGDVANTLAYLFNCASSQVL